MLRWPRSLEALVSVVRVIGTTFAVGGLALGVGSSVGCTNDARDAKCTPDEPDRATSSDCIYAGDGKGPPFVDPECPAIEGEPPADCPSFYDVLDVLGDPARGNCTSLGCHGADVTAQSDIYLPIAEPDVFYAQLLEAHGTVGRPYVVRDDPDTPDNEARESWMTCNLVGEHGGGYPMPPPGGLPNVDDVDVVEDWLLCGAEPPVGCPADAADSECVACTKLSCCPTLVQCLDDAACEPCGVCLRDGGDLASCAAECDLENLRVDGLLGCARARCEEPCPGLAE